MSIEEVYDKIRERIPKLPRYDTPTFVDYLWAKHWEDEHTGLFYSEYLLKLPTETLKEDLEEWAEDEYNELVDRAVRLKVKRQNLKIKTIV